jgi:RNA-binding protein YhbY
MYKRVDDQDQKELRKEVHHLDLVAAIAKKGWYSRIINTLMEARALLHKMHRDSEVFDDMSAH